MSTLRSSFAFTFGLIIAFVLVALAGACTSPSVAEPAPDAAPLPLDPVGRFAVTSTLSLAEPPPAADAVLDELLAATDGPDDPSRYLIDLMIARLPEGRVRTYAEAVAPYAAAYLSGRIDEVAPRFADGARALSTGLSRIAHRFGTTELLSIDASGDALVTAADRGRRWYPLRRTITGLRFDLRGGGGATVEVPFEPEGLPDLVAATRIELGWPGAADELADDRLALDSHTMALPYTALLRLGLDRAVIPSVVPGAHDLAGALVSLVDCAHLGVLVSEWIGLGSPDLYAQSCELGLTTLAARIYNRIDAIETPSVSLALAGAAIAVDIDGDGTMDTVEGGAWTGTLGDASASGTFAGIRR
jgi:hypothetical protein